MVTIADILVEAGVPHAGADHKHGRPGWVQIDCPYCGTATGKFHMGINLSTGAAVCWRCGKHNTAKALSLACGKPAARLRALLDGVAYEAPVVRHTGTYKPPAGVGPMGPAHRAYLQRRGFDPDEIERLWGVQGTGQQGGPMAWRLYVPIYHHGAAVSWTARSIKPNTTQRWLSAAYEQEAVHHKDILYGADYCTHAAIIHEGPTDVWATGPGAVATCGTGYTTAQLKAMARYTVRVVCYDSSPAAQRRARELAGLLAPFPGTTHNVQLETGDDPADADPAEVEELRAAFLG